MYNDSRLISKLDGLSNPLYADYKFGKDNKQSRLLLMYDLHGNYIRSFFGAREAAEFLGMKTYVNIYMHLAGKRKNAYGHLWKIGNRSD